MMQFSLIAAFVALGAVAVMAEEPGYWKCGSAEIVKLDIEGCGRDSDLCELEVDKVYTFHAIFKSKNNMDKPFTGVARDKGFSRRKLEDMEGPKTVVAGEETPVSFKFYTEKFFKGEQGLIQFFVGDDDADWPEFCVYFNVKFVGKKGTWFSR